MKAKTLNKLISVIAILLFDAVSISAQDITSLEKIGAVSSVQRFDKGVILTCADNSHVQITILAPGLIRVRTVFNKSLPQSDHSWAIANTNWPGVRWNLREDTSSILITTDEVEVSVNRSPLLIDFRDVHTHAAINRDEQPMVYDAKGLRNDLQFDPKAGTFVAAAKKLGLDEHFYGLGEKAARLDKRRSSFV